MQGPVGVAVAAAVQPVAVGLAGAGRDGRDPAQVGEGGLAAQPVGVLAGGDQQLAGMVLANREQLQQPGPSISASSNWMRQAIACSAALLAYSGSARPVSSGRNLAQVAINADVERSSSASRTGAGAVTTSALS